jgi:hypothetical protein
MPPDLIAIKLTCLTSMDEGMPDMPGALLKLDDVGGSTIGSVKQEKEDLVGML